MLHALAGPMSPTEAENFYKKMKTPPIPKLHQSPSTGGGSNNFIESRLSDIEKGIERMGRDVAKDLNIPWSEYWNFLDEFCDFSSDEGLEKLEAYLRNCRNSMSEPRPMIEERSPEKSPLSDLCAKMSHMRLQSPKENINEDTFFTPPSSPPSTFFDISPFYILGSVNQSKQFQCVTIFLITNTVGRNRAKLMLTYSGFCVQLTWTLRNTQIFLCGKKTCVNKL